jgi:hypothetical protein
MLCSRCAFASLTCTQGPALTRRRRLSQDDLSEFEESREIVESLADEYKACEGADYLAWCSARE